MAAILDHDAAAAAPNRTKNKHISAPLARKDTVMQQVVETGLMILHKQNMEKAAQFLAMSGVPFHVASRVLMYPALRRKAHTAGNVGSSPVSPN